MRFERLERAAVASYSGFDIDVHERDVQALIKAYAEKNRQQEILWAFTQFDLEAQAVIAERALRLHLKTDEVLANQDLPLTNQHLLYRRVQLQSGIWAVFRPPTDEHNPANEVKVYEISRDLGFTLVPVTVLREYRGVWGSMQAFIPDAKSGNVDFRNHPYSSESLWILDYLTGQLDRNGLNWMIRAGGHEVAIDNSLITLGAVSLSNPTRGLRAPMPPKSLSTEGRAAVTRLQQKLRSPRPTSVLALGEIDQLLKRVEVLLSLPTANFECERTLKE